MYAHCMKARGWERSRVGRYTALAVGACVRRAGSTHHARGPQAGTHHRAVLGGQRMVSVVRWSLAALVCAVAVGAPAAAQAQTGTVNGRVTDSTSQQPLANVTVSIVGTTLGTLTREDGRFSIGSVPAGTQRLRVSRIGYAAQERIITVTAGGTETREFALSTVAARLSEVVVTGYGTQRREAITGSVATVNADEANVGVVANPNQLLQGRVAGVQMTQNAGEPVSGT